MNQEYLYPDAIAHIFGSKDYPHLYGEIRFYQREYCVLIEASIKGLPANDSGFFGFHIHEGNSCTGDNFSDTASHYNPDMTVHPLHSGDLPPLMYCNGNAYMTVTTSRFALPEVIGRTVILHNMADDFNSQPAGNAGTKIACAIIEKVYKE